MKTIFCSLGRLSRVDQIFIILISLTLQLGDSGFKSNYILWQAGFVMIHINFDPYGFAARRYHVPG